MKKILTLLAFMLGLSITVSALTYEEAFDTIKALPEMKGVEGTLISGDNDFTNIGITDGQLVLWDGQTASETSTYGNTIYKIMGELPPDELINGLLNDQNIFVIFAKHIDAGTNRILILSDSARAGFTGALIGHISDSGLESLKKAILVPRENGGTALFTNMMNF